MGSGPDVLDWKNFEVLCCPALWRPSKLLPGLDRPTLACTFSLENGHYYPCPQKSPLQNNSVISALSSLVMNTLEKIVKSLILSAAESMLDPLQFAYRAGRGVEDAKLFLLDKLYKHLELRHSHAWIRFAHFSSAFTTMQPHILLQNCISILYLVRSLRTLWNGT